MDKQRTIIFSIISLFFFLSCSDTVQNAGGSSEETNAIAGRFLTSEGEALAGVSVVMRHASYRPVYSDSLEGKTLPKFNVGETIENNNGVIDLSPVAEKVYQQDSDKEGKWEFSQVPAGEYWVEGSYEEKKILLRVVLADSLRADLGDMHLQKTATLAGQVRGVEEGLEGVQLYLQGTDYYTQSDESGHFVFDSIPQGSYELELLSPDPSRYNDLYMDNLGVFLGINDSLRYEQLEAISAGVESSDDFTTDVYDNETGSEIVELFVQLPLRESYSLLAHWAFENLLDNSFESSVGNWSIGENYGGTLESGIEGLAWQGDGNSYAIVSDSARILTTEEYSISLWVLAETLLSSLPFEKVVFAKYTPSAQGEDVFAFSLSAGVCGRSDASWGVLLADHGALSCQYSLFSNENVEEGDWVHLAAVWSKSNSVCFYKDGDEVACIDNYEKPNTHAPFVFGHEFHGRIDEVKIYKVALTQEMVQELAAEHPNK
jgi:hypothetical protein